LFISSISSVSFVAFHTDRINLSPFTKDFREMPTGGQGGGSQFGFAINIWLGIYKKVPYYSLNWPLLKAPILVVKASISAQVAQE
jgi:hypothetical protein